MNTITLVGNTIILVIYVYYYTIIIMMRTHSIEELSNILKEYFSKCNDISFVYLFGSYLDLKIDYPQDIDIAVHFSDINNENNNGKTLSHDGDLFDFEYELEKLLNYKIDIHEIQDMEIDVQIEVINKSLIIYCKNEEELCDYIEDLSRKACETEYSRMLMKQIRDKIYDSI